MYKEYEAWLKAHYDELLADFREIAVIPAPSHHEEKRAAWVKGFFERYGLKPVIDEALNVRVYFLPEGTAEDAPKEVIIAHTDVVFPDTDPLPLVIDGDIYRAPGIGDDTANLISLLYAIRYIAENGLRPKNPVLFAANSCEEGLGNLKGVRCLCDTEKVSQLVTFDGGLKTAVTTAVGSCRYKVTVRTEGGHSYGAFGNRNAIAYLASMIDTLYRMKVPAYGKTTYNVGTISGGTSVNTIAQEASMLYEFRSDDRRGLDEMRTFFESVLNTYRAMGIEVECELLGVRPCNGDVPADAMAALLKRANDNAEEVLGCTLTERSGSTDANIPLSLGIPATCLGVGAASGAHTREEWVDTAKLFTGAVYCGAYVLGSFEK